MVTSRSAQTYLAEKGYDKQNGARPLGRLIQDEVKKPLGDELLFGALENGGHVQVDVAEAPDPSGKSKQKLAFSYKSNSEPGPKLLH